MQPAGQTWQTPSLHPPPAPAWAPQKGHVPLHPSPSLSLQLPGRVALCIPEPGRLSASARRGSHGHRVGAVGLSDDPVQ